MSSEILDLPQSSERWREIRSTIRLRQDYPPEGVAGKRRTRTRNPKFTRLRRAGIQNANSQRFKTFGAIAFGGIEPRLEILPARANRGLTGQARQKAWRASGGLFLTGQGVGVVGLGVGSKQERRAPLIDRVTRAT